MGRCELSQQGVELEQQSLTKIDFSAFSASSDWHRQLDKCSNILLHNANASVNTAVENE